MAFVSMLLTPSDPGSMLLMLAPLIVLYFGGIQLCKMKPRAEVDPLA
jgi:sec-independent protein translocase protein TatC